MNPFYVSIISLGMLLAAGSLIWMAVDTRKGREETQRLETSKQEIIGILNDAELVIEELNRFSDFVLTKVDEKNKEVLVNLQSCDEKIGKLKEINSEDSEVMESTPKAVNATIVDINAAAVRPVHTSLLQPKIPQKSREKVIHINKRYSEVLELAAQGISETEIARALMIGKGEVQLILGVNK